MLPAAIAADVKLRHLATIIDAAVEPEVGIGRVIGLAAITLVRIAGIRIALVRIGLVRIAGVCLAVLLVAIALVAVSIVPAAIDTAAIVLADADFHGTCALVDRDAVIALAIGAVATAAEDRIEDL